MKHNLPLLFCLFSLQWNIVQAAPPVIAPGTKKAQVTPTKKEAGDPAIPAKILIEGWYDIRISDQKIGFFHEKIVQGEGDQTIQYFNVTRKMQDGVPVEQRIISVSQTKDLSPVSYVFEEIKPSGSIKVEGSVRAGTLYIPALNQTVVLPMGTYFSGLFPLVLQRQAPLKVKAVYSMNLFNEEAHEYSVSKFNLLQKDKKSGQLQFKVSNGDIQFDLLADGKGKILKTLNGTLVIVETNEQQAKDSWPENKLFDRAKPQ